MTKKHFELVAEVLREKLWAEPYTRDVIEELALAFADRLALENDRFDKDRFIKEATREP